MGKKLILLKVNFLVKVVSLLVMVKLSHYPKQKFLSLP